MANYSKARELLRSYEIRGIGRSVDVVHNGKKVGERNLPQALEELHPGAVYFLGGWRYRSKSLVISEWKNASEVESLPYNYPYYTKALVEEYPSIIEKIESKRVFNIEVLRCMLAIKKTVLGYANIDLSSEVTRGEKVFLEVPITYEFKTKGLVFTSPQPKNTLGQTDFDMLEEIAASSFHASEHVVIEGSGMITGGASSDMGGVSLGTSGLIFIYDGSPGGNGATRILYDRMEQVYERGYKILSECNCTSESGCPRCTYSYRCGNNNEYLHRSGATEVMKRILEGEHANLPDEIGTEWRPLV
jgi:DEAD/DEAH box helicase domain-containing protein